MNLPAEPLNPPLASARRKATWRFMAAHPAHWIALGFGSGLSPVAPGTVGTLWAWASFLLLRPHTSDAPMGAAARRWNPRGLLGLHRDRPQPGGSRSWFDRLGRNHRVLADALAGDAGEPLGAALGLRAVPDLRRRQAGPGRLGRRPLQAASRRSDRLAPGIRHPVRRISLPRCARCWSSRSGGSSEAVRNRRPRTRGCDAHAGLEARDGRVLHRRPDRRRLHRRGRFERLVRARLRDLFETPRRPSPSASTRR